MGGSNRLSTGLLLVIWSNGVEYGGPFTLVLEGVRKGFILNIFDIYCTKVIIFRDLVKFLMLKKL